MLQYQKNVPTEKDMEYNRRKVKNMGPSISRRRRKSPWVMIIADVLIAGIGLLIFAYFHHVNPIGVKEQTPVDLPSEAPIVETTPEPDDYEERIEKMREALR